ncbi:hypothetical protein LSCM1_06527 [Leishmania martiniquensis]|uniref:Myotubularin-related 12-like C-terminal domain-containing protein n=1 Tax=Leishmania martiniquensis TaxID=1580590 RepID=A0A836H2P6_9TRYP|nr:hypothetical protein LSCM1_06527 [Leishmania martiniquensis]
MASALAHALQQFRYVTALNNPLPWPHVRHVSIPELRHEPPSLPLMATLLSALSDCGISLKEIREHNDTDILQLVQVLQACLQFSLWSQNILKEKVHELQSTQAEKGVLVQQLESLEKRHHEVEREMASMRKERNVFSLGTAHLRTSLLQMEATIKLQERQLRHERGRNAQLAAKLERALCAQAPLMPAPCSSPSWGPRRSPARDRRVCETAHRAKKATAAFDVTRLPSYGVGAQRDGSTSPASDTSYGDSNLSAEVAARANAHTPRPCDTLDPPPPDFLDWRTLVRYIIHEEQKLPAWASANVSHRAAEVATDERRVAGERELMPAAPRASQLESGLAAASTPRVTEEQLRTFFEELTASVRTDVAAYSRAVAAHAEEIVRAATQQRMQESAKAQQLLVAEVQTTLASFAAELAAHKQQLKGETLLPGMRTVVTSVANCATSDHQGQPAPCSSASASSTVKNAAPAAVPAPTHSSSDGLVTKTGSPPMSDSNLLAPALQTSVSPQLRSTTGCSVPDSDSKARRSLPNFSPDILRTPPTSERGDGPASLGARSDERHSVASRAAGEDERDVDVGLLPLDNSSTASPPDSYQSSHDKEYGATEVGHTRSRVLARPSSAPPVCPTKSQTSAADVIPPPVSSHPSPHHSLTPHLSMSSDVNEGSSYGSSQMLRETRAQLQALLEEERVAGGAGYHR